MTMHPTECRQNRVSLMGLQLYTGQKTHQTELSSWMTFWAVTELFLYGARLQKYKTHSCQSSITTSEDTARYMDVCVLRCQLTAASCNMSNTLV
jgi:hypothetical protein